ncbi:uncharacterized protein LOC130683343 isoform X1 [Manis pentadactyla]|uniref:uncharacterized protein LOC130683343 isoform X1 n=1 Tax=Manis pentadactyla TaxID=143292 RepID=UPI00255CB91E|nr:uncharacterized protein LOC130683343 isoform X1 [Manis pentadactyla]
MTSLCLLILLSSLGTPIQGVLRWGILSAFPKPMPVRYNAVVFPRLFTTNSSINLPYVAMDTVTAPLGENRSFVTSGSLCFTTNITQTNCIPLTRKAYGWYDPYDRHTAASSSRTAFSQANLTLEVIWINGTFVQPKPPKSTQRRPYQPRYAPQCLGDYEEDSWPWTDCQSHTAIWVDENQYFSLSPDMSRETLWKTQGESSISQDVSLNPFHKWLLCGTNGSCTDLSPLSLLLGGNSSMGNVSLQTQLSSSCTTYNATSMTQLHTGPIVTGNLKACRLYQIINNTNPQVVPPTPVCLYPPFLFILSNDGFSSCSNTSCFLSQCWNALNFTNALVARVPR